MRSGDEGTAPPGETGRRIAAWLSTDAATGPHVAPDRLYENVFARTNGSRQHRRWWLLASDIASGRGRTGGRTLPRLGSAPLVGAALVLVALLALAVGYAGGRGETSPVATSGPGPAATAPPTPAPSPPGPTTQGPEAVRATVLASVPTCLFPGALTYAFDSLWVSCSDALLRVDPATARVVHTFRGLGEAAAGPDGMWAIHPKGVVSIDPTTDSVSAVISVPGAVTLAVGNDSVWAASSRGGTLTRIDPRTRTASATIPVGGTPVSLVAADGSVWAADSSGDRVVQVDAASAALVRAIPVGHRPVEVAVDGAAGGSIWTVDNGDGRLSRIDPATGARTVVDVEHDPSGPGSISTSVAFGPDGTAYVTSRGGLFEIAPGAPGPYRVLGFPNGSDLSAVAVVGPSLWLVDGSASTLLKVRP